MQLNVSKDEGTASFQPCQSCGSARLQKLASLPADLLVERVHQGRHIGAEVRPSVVPALPAQGRGVPAGHWDVFVAAQAKLPLLQALEKLWRSYRMRGYVFVPGNAQYFASSFASVAKHRPLS